MLQKFADESRLEQLADAKRRVKQQEHKRAVEAMIVERRERHLIERQEEQEENAQLQQLESYRRTIIEQERQKLLRDHAAEFPDFLPRVYLFFSNPFLFLIQWLMRYHFRRAFCETNRISKWWKTCVKNTSNLHPSVLDSTSERHCSNSSPSDAFDF